MADRIAHGEAAAGGYGARMSEGPSAEVRPPTVQSVDRAVAVLEILAREEWAGVTDIASELGIHKSTAYRLLATLERRGVVEQHAETQKYQLGFTLVRLAGAARSSLDLVRAARPVCERLSRDTDESVNLAVLEAGEVFNVDHVNLSSSRVNVDWLGSHTALHCTSSGKVFLAHADRATRAALLDGAPLERFTPRTVTDGGALRDELAQVRARGFATTVEELEEGLNAVAAPIRDRDGVVIACVSVSGPSYRLGADRLREVGPLTVTAGDDVSRRLGYFGDPRFGAEQQPASR